MAYPYERRSDQRRDDDWRGDDREGPRTGPEGDLDPYENMGRRWGRGTAGYGHREATGRYGAGFDYGSQMERPAGADRPGQQDFPPRGGWGGPTDAGWSRFGGGETQGAAYESYEGGRHAGRRLFGGPYGPEGADWPAAGGAQSEMYRYGEGGSAMSHRGKGPRGYRRSDERITEDVCERLMDSHDVDASEIEVTVADGEVTLNGMVGSRHAKRCAEDCADSVSGIGHVQNNLRVSTGAGQDQAQSAGAGARRKSGTD
jgi:hypothetical protein